MLAPRRKLSIPSNILSFARSSLSITQQTLSIQLSTTELFFASFLSRREAMLILLVLFGNQLQEIQVAFRKEQYSEILHSKEGSNEAVQLEQWCMKQR